ncbi:MAG: triple tyrosine motif-containing protein, partial [Flavobacteriales bacterium]
MTKPFRKLPLLTLFIIAGVCLGASSTGAQTLPPEVTSFGAEKFQAHHQIFCSERLSDGRWAFGTRGVVLIYDGESFQHVKVGRGRPVFSMDQGPSGLLYLGGTSTMGFISPDSSGSMKYRSIKRSVPDSLKEFGSIWSTITMGEKVYFNALSHLFLYDGQGIERIPSKGESFYLASKAKGDLYIQDRGVGLGRIEGNEVETLPGTDPFKGKKGNLVDVLPLADRSKGLFILTRYNGAFEYHPGTDRLEKFPIKYKSGKSGKPLPLRESEIYTAISLNPDKNPYGASYAVGTSRKGIFLIHGDGEVPHVITRKAGTPTEYTWHLEKDGRGNIWASTNDGIALIHTGTPFTLGKEGKFFKGSVQDITSFPVGGKKEHKALAISTSQGVWIWKKRTNEFYPIPRAQSFCSNLLPFGNAESKEKELLLAEDFPLSAKPRSPALDEWNIDTLARYQPYNMTRIELPSSKKKTFLSTGRSSIYGHRKKKKAAEWKTFFKLEGLPDELSGVGINLLEQKADSMRIWGDFRTKGVIKLTVDTAFNLIRKTIYDTSDGLPVVGETNIEQNPIGKGVLFVTDSGLYRFDEGRFHPFCELGNSFCRTKKGVEDFEAGPNGNIWIDRSQNNHIFHLQPKGDGSFQVDSSVFHSLALGTVRSIFPGSTKAWIGGDRGLACYHPEVSASIDKEWDCRISRVKGHRDTLLFGGTYADTRSDSSDPRIPVNEQPDRMVPTLPFQKNHLIFEYAAHYPERPDSVRYSYHLVGYDTSWSKWRLEHKKEYTNLPEGEYCFKVKAKNIYGKESRTASYRFTILPPWYRTWTAYGAFSIMGIAFLYGIMRLWHQRILAQKARL